MPIVCCVYQLGVKGNICLLPRVRTGGKGDPLTPEENKIQIVRRTIVFQDVGKQAATTNAAIGGAVGAHNQPTFLFASRDMPGKAYITNTFCCFEDFQNICEVLGLQGKQTLTVKL